MADTVRVRVYWADGRIETVRQPIDAAITMIVRQDKDDLDADGYVIALEVSDEA